MVDESPKYRKKANGYTKWLRHPDVEKRRKAARMVGELGVSETIEQLQQMADADPDGQVRENARYSLGMFAAFRDAVDSDDPVIQDQAIDAVQRVMETGKIGKITGGTPGWVTPARNALIGLFVVLLVANGVIFFLQSGDDFGGGLAALLPSGDSASEGNNNDDEPQDLETLVQQAQAQQSAIQNNINTLRQQYQPLTTGEIPVDTCPLPYNATLEPLQIADADRAQYRDVGAVYDELNEALAVTQGAAATIDIVCRDRELIPAEEAEQQLVALSAIEAEAAAQQEILTQALIVPTATVAPTLTEPPTEVPTETPSPTPTEIPDVRPFVSELSGIIDEAASGGRNPASLLTQYYNDALNNSGETDGCRSGRPTIPANYSLPPGVGEFSPELQQATVQVNNGLQTLRDGWDTFEEACGRGNSAVLAQADTGLLVAGAAEASFDVANETLRRLLANS